MESIVDAGGVDDVVRCYRQVKGGCLDAAAEDDLRLICKPLVCLVRVWELGCEDLVENGALRVVGFDFLATERAADEVPLILGCVLARFHVVYAGHGRKK